MATREEINSKLASLRTKIANLTPEDYRGERKLPEDVEKAIEFRKQLRKKQRPNQPKFQVI